MGHPAFAAGIEPKCLSQCRGTRAHGQENPQISPLRCASVEMTKGRAALPAPRSTARRERGRVNFLVSRDMKLLPRRLKPHLFAVAYVRRVCEYRVKRTVGPSLRFVPVLMNKRQSPQRKAFDGLRPSFSAHVSRISCRSCWRCAPSCGFL
jgi:hypothetical protein